MMVSVALYVAADGGTAYISAVSISVVPASSAARIAATSAQREELGLMHPLRKH